ncbi:hypothetical protein SUGI_0917990 [Cryptomeria japonica]|nr:hypothetical protein SUGI_0917990 [Cryptomeria japonica]
MPPLDLHNSRAVTFPLSCPFDHPSIPRKSQHGMLLSSCSQTSFTVQPHTFADSPFLFFVHSYSTQLEFLTHYLLMQLLLPLFATQPQVFNALPKIEKRKWVSSLPTPPIIPTP